MKVQPGDQVRWLFAETATVVGVFEQPSAIIEWPNGERSHVGLDMLTKVES